MTFLQSWPLVVGILLVSVRSSNCVLVDTQLDVLRTIYDATNGLSWNFDSFNSTEGKAWDFSVDEDPCFDNWNGILCNLTYSECSASPCELTSLVLSGVGMTGSLPDILSPLSTMHTLVISENELTSLLPETAGDLTGLRTLSLGDNDFSGPIPPSYSRLTSLRILDLKGNRLSKQIPVEILETQFQQLEVFYIGENKLSGPVPALIGSTNIRRIYLTENFLTGTIPSSYYTFSKLQYLGLATNCIDGTLSSDIGNLKELSNFYAGYNAIESTLPSEIGQLTKLEYFLFTKNKLYGTVPKEIGNWVNLLVLELNINDLTGPLPAELGQLPLMHSLYLHENQFTGTIPSTYTNLKSMQLFILSDNQLTGTVPEGMSGLSSLYDFSVYNNRLSGEVCSEMFLLPRLEKFLLQNNAFTGFRMEEGTLDAIGNLNISVLYLDISNNGFHGTIPSLIFSKLNNILSLAATKNCFSGSLPESLCDCQTLRVLTLDGLASGDSCRNKIFYPFSLFNAYLITPMEGSIPHCYWSMPNLTVLHLSGNGLGGSILSDIPNNNLQNISLSFNRLTGSIPRYLMEHHFVELSLSNNKLSGIFDTLHFEESAGALNRSILDITTNRLSGFVPLHICDVDDLSTLEGNLFDCNHHHALPYNDPYHEEYICASKQLSQPIFVCVVILCSFAVISLYALALLYRSNDSFDNDSKEGPSWADRGADYLRNVMEWTSLKALEGESLEGESSFQKETSSIYAPNLKVFVGILRMLRKTFLIISIFLVVVCVPLYYVIKHVYDGYYSTHEHQYTWTYSTAYMSGTASAALVMLIFCISCFIVTFTLNVFVKENKVNTLNDDGVIQNAEQERKAQSRSEPNTAQCIEESDDYDHCKQMTFRVMSYGIVMSCNILVYILINSGYIFLLRSASLDSSMKLLANFAMAIIKLFWNLFVVPISTEFTAKRLGDEFHHLKWMIAFLLLFNNIAAPALATAFTDDKCYEQLIAPTCEIDAFYELPVCNIYALDVATQLRECFEYIQLSIETPFDAPFIYNYQCSSSIIVNYVPVFLFVYAFLGLMFPLMYCVLLFSTVYISSPQWIKDVIPALLIPPDTLQHYPQSLHVPVIRPNRIIATLMSHFAVLLTFGVASPLLGLAIGVSLCVLTYMHQLIIGRYLIYHCSTKEAECNVTFRGSIDGAKYSGGLEHACSDFLSGLPACLWTIIVGSNLLFSFIVFDSVGDKRGFMPAMVSSVVTIVTVPVLVYVLYKVALRERSKHISANRKSRDNDSMESSVDEAERPLLH